MRLLLIILILHLNFTINAQRIKSEYLISKSDSILLAHVGKPIIVYFNFDYNQGSFYSYINKLGKYRTGSVKQNKRTKGIFINANIRYTFSYPEIKEVKGSTFVSYNGRYEIVDKLELEYIPEFLKLGNSCNFISKINAAKIGLDSLIYKGLAIEGPLLSYDYVFKKYVYTISTYIERNCCVLGQEYGQKEVIVIDAISGQILHHGNENFGRIIIR